MPLDLAIRGHYLVGMTFVTCSSANRDKGKLYVCILPLNHDGKHRDGDHEWDSPPPPDGPEVVFNT